MKKKILIHAWKIEKRLGKYYLPFSHWIYLKEIVKYYDEVVLLSSCKEVVGAESDKFGIEKLGNVSVYELPASSNGYAGAMKYFFHFNKAYRVINGVSTYYSRYPTPFGWLQKLYGRDKKRIIHYVGDPIDAAKSNPNFSFVKKIILLSGFYIENALYTWACKGASVFTNGHHLSEMLLEKGIVATPVISSTLNQSDFFYKNKVVDASRVQFVYLGYLRTAKGIETILKAFALYNTKFPKSTFKIIGSGELDKKLKSIVVENRIRNVSFLGQLENRNEINKELRSADIFLFGSLSEGSPRVILEAMANGLSIISTPVGSLPTIFEDKKDITFSNFNDSKDFYEKMLLLSGDDKYFQETRLSAFNKVRHLTIEGFIKGIFYE